MNATLRMLQDKGVRFTHPESVEIGPEVDPGRISGDGVVIYGGCRIYGAATSIASQVVLGEEAPVTLSDCRLGPKVRLKGGFFKDAVLLEGVSMGSGAHVREGTILEEEARGAHTVGLKQTILFPYVTLGSLINFCDCLMAGGTGRKNHSEVGSSYIHFNYTPYQDKATPSMMGDVPRGVMLNQPPIFLGGQGGLVGPCRLDFGTVVAAGSLCRKDELRPNRLLLCNAPRALNTVFKRNPRPGSERIVQNNILYIANLMALTLWYRDIRSRFVTDAFSRALQEGLEANAAAALQERVRRFRDYMEAAIGMTVRWDVFESVLQDVSGFRENTETKDRFLFMLEETIAAGFKTYLGAVKNLGAAGAAAGTAWLQQVVDATAAQLRTAVFISSDQQ